VPAAQVSGVCSVATSANLAGCLHHGKAALHLMGMPPAAACLQPHQQPASPVIALMYALMQPHQQPASPVIALMYALLQPLHCRTANVYSSARPPGVKR
jgi:hypothetical protein